ncbi:MAG: glycosyltransferase [Thermoanaerobaculia bacterium]|nr:glycosyltransferase [Thermoanaerobaculia bacterium]
METRRLLVAQGSLRGVEAAIVQPLARHAAALRERFGVRVEIVADAPRRLLEEAGDATADWLFVASRLFDREPRQAVAACLAELRRRFGRLVWLDGQDSTMREQFWVTPYVDLTLRRSLVHQRALYGRPCLQGRLHAEAVRRRLAPRCGPWRHALGLLAGERPALAALSLARIWHSARRASPYVVAGERFPERAGAVAVGWNLALGDGLLREAKVRGATAAPRDIDLFCRARVGFRGLPAWYSLDRLAAVGAARRLGRRWRVVASTGHLPRDRYFAEMERARLAISPFGWGEVCWRDFEAILCGCLLVKPSMRHVETWPDVYRPFETYLPVRWDWSDLATVCRPYLEDESLRRRLADAARARLLAELGEAAFVARFAGLHARLAAPRAASIPA